MSAQRHLSRREFIAATTLAAAGCALNCAAESTPPEPIIDIHQHLNYGGKRDAQWNFIGPGRSDEQTLQHQHNMGVTRTILLPAGRFCRRASTHQGQSNGLEGTCTGNDACYALAQSNPKEFWFAANEVPDLEDAPGVIEDYLKKGAVCIAEQKFGVECDSPQMQTLYQLAADYRVPILMHWQYGTYNYGYEGFHKMLEKHPKTTFVGHAQTFWAHIDQDYQDGFKTLYPKGKIKAGGLTDRYLSDYPNFVGDLSAGSGNNALRRDPDHTRGFLERHQNQLVFGSDCVDHIGHGEACSGWSTIQVVRQLSPSKKIERKLLYENALRIYRLT
jgi:predicted TIM-barrel fold metal-dependent hydrolase